MRRTLLLLVAMTLPAPLVQSADPPRAKDEKPRRERHVDPEKSTPEARAAKRAQDMNGGGRVLSVTPDADGHRVKVLKKGEVHVIHVPAEDPPQRPPEQHP
jgi:hypothetical protein